MLKLPKICLKTYNLQNSAIKVIILKTLLHLKSSHTEVTLRLTIPRIPCIFQGKASTSYKEALLDNTADKVI